MIDVPICFVHMYSSIISCRPVVFYHHSAAKVELIFENQTHDITIRSIKPNPLARIEISETEVVLHFRTVLRLG